VNGTVAPAGSDGVVVSFNAAGLTVGETYTTKLVIGSNDPNENPVEVGVALEVQEGLPDIEVTPLSFSLVANVGEEVEKTLTIANVGGTDLTWTLAEDPAVGWFSATPVNGTVAPAGSDEVVVSFDASGLTVGETYTTMLVVGSNDPNENPVEVEVELEVQEGLPDIEVTPLSLVVTAGLGETVNRTLTVANVGGDDLTWALVESPAVGWLDELPQNGTVTPSGSDAVVVSFDTTGLVNGETYTTTLLVNSNDPNEASVEVGVELVVEPCEGVAIQLVASNSPVKVGETMLFTATVTGSEPISYIWDFGGAGSATGEDTATPTYTYDAVGEYTVALTVTNPCDSDFYTLEVSVEKQMVYLPIVAKAYTP
jgi:hypothetical protein